MNLVYPFTLRETGIFKFKLFIKFFIEIFLYLQELLQFLQVLSVHHPQDLIERDLA